MKLVQERAAVAHYAQRLRPDRLVVGTSGNISVRSGELVAVTPSGLDYDALSPELVCVTDMDGTVVEGELEPTSEIRLHLGLYATTPHQAIVHTHATAATAVSTLVDELPTVHYLTALFGGPVPVAPYQTYGTEELAREARKALADRTGCLLANHGTVTVGPTLATAYELNHYLEWLCEVWLRARGAGEPRTLSREEIDRVARRLATYGQTAPSL